MTAGDVSAPERIWTVSGAGGRSWGFVKDGPDMGSTETVELVELSRLREAEAAYARVVAERDEARAGRGPLTDRALRWSAAAAEDRARADRYREAARALARIATGEVGHDFMGRCPSDPDDDIRDPGCPACRVLSEWDETRAALAEGEQSAGSSPYAPVDPGNLLQRAIDARAGEQPESETAAVEAAGHATTLAERYGEVILRVRDAVHREGLSDAAKLRHVQVALASLAPEGDVWHVEPAAGVQSTTGQRQDSTADQVESVRLLAQRHGCYDAADWIARMREVDAERHTYPLDVGVQSTTETGGPEDDGAVAWRMTSEHGQPVWAHQREIRDRWIAEGIEVTPLYEHPSPSTTETATGDEDPVTRIERIARQGDCRVWSIGGNDYGYEAWLHPQPGGAKRFGSHASLSRVLDEAEAYAHDLAAAPASPETESEGNDG